MSNGLDIYTKLKHVSQGHAGYPYAIEFSDGHVAGCHALESAELVCGMNIKVHTLGFDAPVIWEQHAPGHWLKRKYLVLQVLGSKVVSSFMLSNEATRFAIEAEAEQVFCLTHGPGGWYQTDQDVIDAARRVARETKKANKQLGSQGLLRDLRKDGNDE